MTFWQDTELEPKRSFRFTMSVTGENNAIREFLIEKVSKPSFSIGEVEAKYLNHSFFYPGKITWNDVTFTVIDCLKPSDANATVTVMKMLEASGYDQPSSPPRGNVTMSKKAALKALGMVKIHQFPGGTPGAAAVKPEETWTLVNAWIKEVKFGDLEYGNEEMQKIDITLKYDNAYVWTGESGNLPTGAKS